MDASGKPKIRLGIAGEDAEHRYRVGEIQILPSDAAQGVFDQLLLGTIRPSIDWLVVSGTLKSRKQTLGRLWLGSPFVVLESKIARLILHLFPA